MKSLLVIFTCSMLLVGSVNSGYGAMLFDTKPKVCRATLGGVEVSLEVADDVRTRTRGLMYRKSLPENYGMIFIFDTEKMRSFWMKNTLIDLDIAFLNKEGVIVDIKRMLKHSQRTTQSDAPAMYAIEMNAGWFPANNVTVGDTVDFLDLQKE
ncbi:DUF192 domain-containing protein [Candidatus Omnitrophota bacterium]